MKRHLAFGIFAASILFGGQLTAPPAQAEVKVDRDHEAVHVAERVHVQDLPIHRFGRLETCRGWWSP